MGETHQFLENRATCKKKKHVRLLVGNGNLLNSVVHHDWWHHSIQMWHQKKLTLCNVQFYAPPSCFCAHLTSSSLCSSPTYGTMPCIKIHGAFHLASRCFDSTSRAPAGIPNACLTGPSSTPRTSPAPEDSSSPHCAVVAPQRHFCSFEESPHFQCFPSFLLLEVIFYSTAPLKPFQTTQSQPPSRSGVMRVWWASTAEFLLLAMSIWRRWANIDCTLLSACRWSLTLTDPSGLWILKG